MVNLIKGIGINDKNGTPIMLGDRINVSSDDFEGKLILNEEGIVFFDYYKNIYYVQKSTGQILLQEKYKNNYTVLSRSDVNLVPVKYVFYLFAFCLSLLLITMFLLYNL